MMNYWHILPSTAAISVATLLGCAATQSPYDHIYLTRVDGQEVEVLASDNLIQRSLQGLSSRSLEIHKKAIAVFMMSDNEMVKLDYISAFPESFDEFLLIFHPHNYAELYSYSYTYLDLFHQLSLEFPRLTVRKYVDLARSACMDADAPNQFRENLGNIRKRFPELYEQSVAHLTVEERHHIELVDDASIHDWEPQEIMCSQN